MIRMRTRVAVVVLSVCIAALALARAATSPQIAEVSCSIARDRTSPVRPPPGAATYCGIDLGSRSVKLSVVSMRPGADGTVKDERLCRRTLGMGALVFDSRTRTARPLPDEAIGRLVETIAEFQQICRVDGGSMVGIEATQWSRDATNIADVRSRVRSATGLDVDVLTPAQEAEYGYVAASLNVPGRVVLDPGSNSFQLSWRGKASARIESVLIEYGYVRGSTNDFEGAASYAAGRSAYQAKVRALIEAALHARTPSLSLAGLRQQVATGRLGRDLIALGQDGAVDLAVRDQLRDGRGGWVSEAHAFDDVLARQPIVVDPGFGAMTAKPLLAGEITSFLDRLKPADLRTLSTEPVRGTYGQKAMVVPALVDLLLRELGLTQLVMVPQEMTTGYILATRAVK
jgi:hypothetical protein